MSEIGVNNASPEVAQKPPSAENPKVSMRQKVENAFKKAKEKLKANKEHKEAPTPGETVLIFGQGPVITEPDERINYWSKDLAKAAGALQKLDPNIKNFVVMGGQTGGPNNSSEAHLIAQDMQNDGVESNRILLEEQSNDTVENIVNYLNMTDGENTQNKLSILTAPYHSARTQVLLGLFGVDVKNVFQSTAVLKVAAMNKQINYVPSGDATTWDNKALQELEDKTDINDPTKFSSKQPAGEQRDFEDRLIKDDLWTRELLEHPDKWLPYVGKLTNNSRIQGILNQVEGIYPGMLEQKYGIKTDNITEAKTRLTQMPSYPGLTSETVDQWVKDNKSSGWPETTAALLAKIHERKSAPQTQPPKSTVK